jgi:hypothetical protein
MGVELVPDQDEGAGNMLLDVMEGDHFGSVLSHMRNPIKLQDAKAF